MNNQINYSSKRTAAIFSTNHEMSLNVEAPLDKKNVKIQNFNRILPFFTYFSQGPIQKDAHLNFLGSFMSSKYEEIYRLKIVDTSL